MSDEERREAVREEFTRWAAAKGYAPAWRTGVPAEMAVSFGLYLLGDQEPATTTEERKAKP